MKAVQHYDEHGQATPEWLAEQRAMEADAAIAHAEEVASLRRAVPRAASQANTYFTDDLTIAEARRLVRLLGVRMVVITADNVTHEG